MQMLVKHFSSNYKQVMLKLRGNISTESETVLFSLMTRTMGVCLLVGRGFSNIFPRWGRSWWWILAKYQRQIFQWLLFGVALTTKWLMQTYPFILLYHHLLLFPSGGCLTPILFAMYEGINAFNCSNVVLSKESTKSQGSPLEHVAL